MTEQRRTTLAAAVIGATLLAGVGWCASYWSDAVDSAAAATSDLTSCEKVGRQIELLRAGPGAAGGMTGAAVADRVAAALDRAGIDAAGQGRVVPQSPRPTDVAGIAEVPATVALHHVKLPQALTFAAAIGAGGGGLTVRGFKLATPAVDANDPAEDDDWDAEVTVAYRVAVPDNPARTGGGS